MLQSESPDARPHRRYTVTLSFMDGSTRMVRVLTNRGQAKAAYLAALSSPGLLRKRLPVQVEVQDDGPPELDTDGTPVLRGYAADRQEW